MIIYVVGQHILNTPWNIIGIFDTPSKAELACIDHTFFVGPIELNYKVDFDISDWHGAYFPKAKKV